MAYEFLKKLFKDTKDGEEPTALTYQELEEAINADKGLKLVNLGDGDYVAKNKFDAKVTELEGLQNQLSEANAQIQSFKDLDIDAIKQKATDWETKYNTDTKALNDKLEAQERSHQVDNYFSKYKFTSVPAMRGIRNEFENKNFTMEDGKFLGADEFMKGLMENDDYKSAFVIDEPSTQEPPSEPSKPIFSSSTANKGKDPQQSMFGFNFTGVRKKAE